MEIKIQLSRKELIINLACCLSLLLTLVSNVGAQSNRTYSIIGYYTGNVTGVNNVPAKKLTHLIYGFCSLRGNQLYVADSLTVKRLVALKKQNPKLKVQLALGGWGGCKNCSALFAQSANRIAFALSVKQACRRLGVDGIDLDWEYPAVKGFPGHRFVPEDKENFTKLILQLRQTLGNAYEISFAAGAFTEYLENSIDWLQVMKLVDRVNLMTYDLVNGYSPITGHHTALYSTPDLVESVDHAVSYLLKLGVPSNKLVIGAAFYARVWQNANAQNNGLYQPAKPKSTIGIGLVEANYTAKNGYVTFWDDAAKAPYKYNATSKIFVTYDDERSIRLKTKYLMQKQLGGIMFWQLRLDRSKNSLLDVIYNSLNAN